MGNNIKFLVIGVLVGLVILSILLTERFCNDCLKDAAARPVKMIMAPEEDLSIYDKTYDAPATNCAYKKGWPTKMPNATEKEASPCAIGVM